MDGGGDLFVDREVELAELRELADRRGMPTIALVYGRRRVGKTYLLDHAWPDRRVFYFVAADATTDLNRSELIRELTRWSGQSLDPVEYPTWRTVFRLLGDFAEEQPLIAVLDEFQYLMGEHDDIASQLVAIFDRELRGRSLLLVLSGSSISMMEQLLHGSQPLFGRSGWKAKIGPFDYRDAARMVPDRPVREQALVYGIFGGTPRYLAAIRPGEAFADVVMRTMLSPRGEVYLQLEYLIEQEKGIRKDAEYNSILAAIADGELEVGKIVSRTGVERDFVRMALKTLEELGYVWRERNFDASRTTPYQYRIADNALAFWFRFVHANRSRLGTGAIHEVWEHHVVPYLDAYMGKVFERMCHEAFTRYHGHWGLAGANGWARDPAKAGRLTASLLGESDNGQAFDESGRSSSPNGRRGFAFSYSMTSTFPIKVGRETYAEPALVEDRSRALSWLRTNAFASNARGWFAAGYGPFRRLPKADGILVPSLTLDPPTRASGFATLFDEDRALNTFDRWMVSLDYRIAKDPHDDEARRMRDVGERTIARLLPKNTRILDVADDGMTRFRIDGRIVPSTGLSDGYRSVVALAGDLIWRLMQAYPDLDDPTHAPGVVLIDELDAHLHPSWQRQIAGWLRDTFPQLQFIVATHSPLIAIGAGEDARTLRLETIEGETRVTPIKDLSAYDADRALRSPAFGLPSTHSPTTDDKIRRYHELRGRLVAGDVSLDAREKKEYEKLEQFMAEAQPIGGQPEPGSLEARIDAYLESVLR